VPCYRCGTRQTDPVRGPSPWKRGVVHGELILVCPDCQRVHDWVGDLDRCPACGSTSLTRALGETTCKACGTGVPSPDADPPATVEASSGLASDVEAALARTFHRSEE
jgi:hypothetical protein